MQVCRTAAKDRQIAPDFAQALQQAVGPKRDRRGQQQQPAQERQGTGLFCQVPAGGNFAFRGNRQDKGVKFRCIEKRDGQHGVAGFELTVTDFADRCRTDHHGPGPDLPQRVRKAAKPLRITVHGVDLDQNGVGLLRTRAEVSIVQ